MDLEAKANARRTMELCEDARDQYAEDGEQEKAEAIDELITRLDDEGLLP